MSKKSGLLSVLVGLVIFSLSTVACAQPSGGSQQGGQQGPPPTPTAEEVQEMVSKLSVEIALAPEVEAEVLGLYQNHFSEVEDKMESKPSREEMDAYVAEFESQVKALLTPEQQEKFDAFQKSNKPQRKGQGGPPQ